MKRPLPLPLLVALLALVGALSATVFLYREASQTAETMLDQRLLGTGNTAALLLGPTVTAQRLKGLMDSQSLDGAFLVDLNQSVRADATGPDGNRVDLLRVDGERLAAALAGAPSIGHGYDLGGVRIRTGYFPVHDAGAVTAVLVLEAGAGFAGTSTRLERALLISVLLALVVALALAAVATRQVRAERARQDAMAKISRAELLTQVAAAAAHEIRNPLGVIRGTVELMRERDGLDARGRAALGDVLGEVDRLKRLTEDLLDLSADRPLALENLSLQALLEETVGSARAAFPTTRFELDPSPLPQLLADAGRLRQVLLNLIQNAAQAAPNGTVTLTTRADAATVSVLIADDGKGISPEVAARLFEPFASARDGGTGLGLALSRRWVEHHGGTLRNVTLPVGTAFEMLLPVRMPQ